tara:strand:- start:637 stop:1098 length:462 start_codon:yes stop_codon:yes gene_type:complete
MKKIIDIIKNIKMFTTKEVALGEGSVTQFTLFECKELFSIIFYKWNTIDQVRFHTHAFPAYAFLLRGFYHEKVLTEDGEVVDKVVNQLFKPRFLARNYCHSIGYAKPSTMTMVLVGRWSKQWKEYFPDTNTWITYEWGRKKVSKKVSNLNEKD